MKCNLNDVPLLGLVGITNHRILNMARGMYKEFDMSRSQADILFTLNNNSSLSQKELAERLNVSAPSITLSIQRMEREGFITRIADKMDQRVMRLSLTEKGQSCILSVKEVGARMEEIAYDGMSQEERLMFRRLLIQVNDNLDQFSKKEEKRMERKGTL